MATLEKIRKRSVLLFTIIIVALLAFILGDFLTSGRTFFGHGNNIAKVGSAKVDVQKLEEREKMFSERYQQAGQEGDPDEIRQQAIQSLLMEELMNQEYEALGITVTDAEISAHMMNPMPGTDQGQFISYVSQQLGLQAPSAQAVYDAMQNPAKYGLDAQSANTIRAMWAQQETALEEQLKGMRFSQMIGGLYTANELDARSLYEAINTASTISYAAQLFTDVPDADVKVTEEEIQAAYAAKRAMYRLPEETIALNIIRVPIDPSGEDMNAAQAEVKAAVEQMIDVEGVPDAVRDNNKFIVETRRQPRRLIENNALIGWLNGNAADTASHVAPKPGDVKLIQLNKTQAQIAKLMGVSQEIDSVKVSQIMARNPKEADSILSLINGGMAMADYIAANPGVGAEKQPLALIGSQLPKQFADQFRNAPVGTAFVYADTIVNGAQKQPVAMVLRIDERQAPVNVYDYAEITYPIHASPATVSKLNGDLNKFAKANHTADAFRKAGEKSKLYQPEQIYVTPSSPHIGDMKGTRSIIKWASEADAGDVSPIMQDRQQEAYYLVALDAKYSDGYAPLSDKSVREAVRAELLAEKKAAKRIDALKGKAKNLEGYASLMKSEVKQAETALTTYGITGLGFQENELQGLVAGAKKGQLVGPVKGSTHVVVFRVDGVQSQGRPYNFDEMKAQFARATPGAIFSQNNIFNVLVGNDEYVNYSLDFEAAN